MALLPAALLAVEPAHADVLEIGSGGDASWISGPNVDTAPVSQVQTQSAPLAEVPAEARIVPEYGVADPSRQAEVVPDFYAAKVAELAARFDLSPALIEALVWQESRWRAGAVSPAGARGLAQLMPGTARDLGVNPDDPFANLEGGARYLRAQLDRFDGDIEKALAAYNAGPGRVAAAGGIPRIRETQTYVASVMGRLSDHSRSED
ncbi:lytic transglycosylase domain-containing protein [Altererythrobacter sp. Root672]|uniref:lytic transglycosylase domain-containing protein n=1 Tax=Altererythrobacter sp. Root672 TaxID=1736584 RepID=UPI001F26A828|nr:lytic transglycosylase domain-containing protein [Altererythrobacter sp. Root672]